MSKASDKEKLEYFKKQVDRAFTVIQDSLLLNEIDSIVMAAACTRYVICAHKIEGQTEEEFASILEYMKADFRNAKIVYEEEIE